MFNRTELEAMLKELGNTIKSPVTLYLIGGCSMSLKSLKETTKDVDCVVLSNEDLNIIVDALYSLKYASPFSFKEEIYLTAMSVFERGESRIDLFLNHVCKKLEFSKDMQSRATLFNEYGKLKVMLTSNEDLFLFKAMASESDRPQDISDCETLITDVTLDWSTIIKECLAQKQNNVNWIFFLFEFMSKFEDATNKQIPVKNQVYIICKQHWSEKPAGFMSVVKDPKKHIKESRFLRDILP